MDLNLTKNLIPKPVQNKTGDAVQNPSKDCLVKETNPSSSFTLEYPKSLEKVPLAGGAVISLTYEKAIEDIDLGDIFKSQIDSLSTMDQTGEQIVLLTRMRNQVNQILKSISKKDIIRQKLGLPNIFISTYLGDDSEFIQDHTKPIPDISKICSFRYIPLKELKEISRAVSRITNLQNVGGVSGRLFADLPDSSTVDLVLEFFTIFNISVDDIVGKTLNVALGGFYTYDFENKIIYFKMPDLSGKDSYGYSPDIFSDRNFYIEIENASKLQRLKIENVSVAPSISITGDYPDEIPELESFDLTITSNKDLARGYLSILMPKKPHLTSVSGIKTTTDGVELFTAPILTQPTVKGREPTFNISNPEFDQQTKDYLMDIFDFQSHPQLITKDNIDKVGIANQVNFDQGSYFGEKNRPEVLLLDENRDIPRAENDKKYWNDKITEARSLFCNIRPKIYHEDQIPALWLRSNNIKKNSDGSLTLSFPRSEINKINKNNIKNIRFVIYAQDAEGQLARASDILSLDLGQPVLTSSEPTGFSDSAEISPFKFAKINFKGENLSTIQNLKFISEGGQTILFKKGVGEDASVLISDNEIIFNSHKELIDLGFTPTTTYSVFGESKFGKISSITQIYVSDGAGGQLAKQKQLPDFSDPNSLYFVNKNKKIATEVPIIYKKNASLKIKSKNSYFNGEYSIFAYFVAPQSERESLRNIDLSSNLIDLRLINSNDEAIDVTIASGISYEFSNSLLGSDFHKVSNRVAQLSFPGDKFQSRNFDALISKNSDYYILFTSRPINEIRSNLDRKDYFLLQLGDRKNNVRPFSSAPNIVGIAATSGSDQVISNFMIGDKYDVIYDYFNSKNKNSSIGKINAFNRLSDLAIVFYGDEKIGKNKKYKFFIGSNDITSKLSRKISRIGETNEYIAFFKNIQISEIGDLEVFIEKEDKEYNINSSSRVVSRRGSYLLDKEDVQFDKESSELVINKDIDSSSSEGSKLILNYIKSTDPILSEIFLPLGSGIALKSLGSQIEFIHNVNLESNFDLQLSTENKLFKLLRQVKEFDIGKLDSKVLQIPAGTRINHSDIVIDSVDQPREALAFLNLLVDNPHIISFNQPRILALSKGPTVNQNHDPNLVRLEAGEDYSILVDSSDRNFSLIFDDNIVVLPKNIKQVGNKRFKAQFKAPKKLANKRCPKISASISNAERNRAKLELGHNFTIDIERQMTEILDGKTKVKIPDLDDLKRLIEDFPLRFVSFKLDQASIPADLINSFCDMSFHLTADLKIALNGFQALMVPVQVIFCIIDVICSLLNPVKMAKAVIRLFQCLYDLILLLPQISVPVMFLQLILHLVKLLECVFEKVSRLIIVINEIIKSLQLAVKNSLWGAIKSLEEVLSENLMDLKVSLSVLDPIVSILSIFLQLLGLVFRFPCSITDDEDEFFCIDGSMLGGLILGRALKSDKTYQVKTLLPVGQPYSNKSLSQAIQDGSSAPLVEPINGLQCAIRTGDKTYLDVLNVDSNTLRSTYSNNPSDFNLTFSISTTKSRKGLGSPELVRFEFDEKGRNGVFNKKKIIDPEQTLDGPLSLVKNSNNKLTIETGSGKNIISPIDDYEFLNISGNTASVKPLTLEIEMPIIEIDEETGKPNIVGQKTIPRTFDNIPSMAILDEDFNVYFIEPNGISLRNGRIESIQARIVNLSAAEKKKFQREQVEIDTDGDGSPDDEAPVYDFPQIYFFDMREIAKDIETKCSFDFFNNDLLNDNPDDISDIVEEGQDCIVSYQGYINQIIENIRTSLSEGKVPELIDTNKLTERNQELEECLDNSIDRICIYVVNSLNSQFKILDDEDHTSSTGMPDFEIDEDLLDDFEISGPALTGAREYAAGIGDSAEIKVGQFATVQITPRDSYDNVIPGDLSNKIAIEIVSDTTKTARLLEENGERVFRNGDDYLVKVSAQSPGVVRIRAKICNKTIQAITYPELSEDDLENDFNDDCVPAASNSTSNTNSNNLTKIDRILTIYFVDTPNVIVSDLEQNNFDINTKPQVFGTTMEN